jgi:hypothetical protein
MQSNARYINDMLNRYYQLQDLRKRVYADESLSESWGSTAVASLDSELASIKHLLDCELGTV